MNHFDIRLTAQELDHIANVLSQQPWAQVNALLANIKSQIDYQQKESQIPQTGNLQVVPNGHDTASTN